MLSLSRLMLSPVVLALVLSGCGDQSPEATRAERTVTRAFHALAAGDGAGFCSLSTAAAQRTLVASFPGADCPRVVRIVSAHLTVKQRAAAATVRVARVTVKGATATVRAADISSSRGTFKGFLSVHSPPTRLARQADGSWKISG